MPRVGFLHPGKVEPGNTRLVTFAEGLRSKGYVEGRNVSIIVRGADYDPGRTAQYAAELIDSKVDVLFAVAARAIQEARVRTSTLPIVAIDLESDPVASGFVKSLAHPGGNLTGFTHLEPTFGAKWLDLLKEIAPNLSRAALMFNAAATPQAALFLRSVEAAAPQFAVKAVAAPVHELEEMRSKANRNTLASCQR